MIKDKGIELQEDEYLGSCDVTKKVYEVWHYDDWLGYISEGKNGMWAANEYYKPFCEDEFFLPSREDALKYLRKI